MLPIFISLLSGSLQEPKPVEVIDLLISVDQSLLPTAVSDKGDVAVGRTNNPGDDRSLAWVWTKQQGLQIIKEKPGKLCQWTVTGDGRFFAGSLRADDPKAPLVYYGLSSNPSSMATIGHDLVAAGGYTSEQGLRFSNDGRYLVGRSNKFKDTLQIHDMKGGPVVVLPVATPGVQCNIQGISADGSRVLFSHPLHNRHYLWDRKRPQVVRQIRIPMFEAQQKERLTALSDDGKYVAGYALLSEGRTVFKWSEEKGVEPGPAHKWKAVFQANVINGDGSIVGGRCAGEDGWEQASIWFDKFKEIRSIKSMLKPGELPHPKVVFKEISDISPDGTVFLMSGFIPQQGKPTEYHTYIVKFASKAVMESR